RRDDRSLVRNREREIRRTRELRRQHHTTLIEVQTMRDRWQSQQRSRSHICTTTDRYIERFAKRHGRRRTADRRSRRECAVCLEQVRRRVDLNVLVTVVPAKHRIVWRHTRARDYGVGCGINYAITVRR